MLYKLVYYILIVDKTQKQVGCDLIEVILVHKTPKLTKLVLYYVFWSVVITMLMD